MLESSGKIWKQRIQGQICALLAPAYLKTLDYRMYYFDRATDPVRPEYDEHCVFVFWHEYISVILPQWGHAPLSVLCSKHRDGEIVNQAAAALGLHIVRGSSNRGGSDAIRQLRKNSHFSSIAITPDGPRGPRREMAIGPVYLASLLQMPIVPVGIGIDRAWRLDTWDQFALPKPFARIRLILGPKIRIPERLGREQLETSRAAIVKLMNDLTNEAQHWVESGLRIQDDQPRLRVRRCNRMVFDQTPHRNTTAGDSKSQALLQAGRFSTNLNCLIRAASLPAEQPRETPSRMRA